MIASMSFWTFIKNRRQGRPFTRPEEFLALLSSAGGCAEAAAQKCCCMVTAGCSPPLREQRLRITAAPGELVFEFDVRS